MHFQRLVITTIILPLAIAAPVVNPTIESKSSISSTSSTSSTMPMLHKYNTNTPPSQSSSPSPSLLNARQLLWTILGPLGLEPVIDGINGAVVGLGLR
ncbi:hypothetical protein SBOR_0696 [Sclerotinia borealis F-4128]|uniref:Uncharacterized protein n=1 Tax=Sclerotinia borealis (strain F-4128) TaxID=1432307 RepID=W9CWK8_SCLBF|nr:hypothetical protein SBOR_0696 [Sclerotinia borealis F-4128]